MYFPISDILNDTVFGIPKDEVEDLDSVINIILTDKECKA